MSEEIQTAVMASTLATLIGTLATTANTLCDLRKQIGETNFGLSYLSKNLQHLNDTLACHQQQIREHHEDVHSEVLTRMDLCIFCCDMFITHTDAQLGLCSPDKAECGLTGVVARLRREYRGWRLGTRVIRLNKAFDRVFEVDDREADQRGLLHDGREKREALSKIQDDTVSLFDHPALSLMPRCIAACWGRHLPNPRSREEFIQSLSDKHLHTPISSTLLQDYVTISNPEERSRYIDHALAEDGKRLRQQCRIPIFGSSGTFEDRVLNGLHEYLPHEIHGNQEPKDYRVLSESPLRIGNLRAYIVNLPRRGERKQYIHLFEGSEALICFGDLERERFESGDPDVDRFDEFSTFFESMRESRWFKQTPIILVLDNVGRLARTLDSDPLKRDSHGYSNGAGIPRAAEYALRYLAKPRMAKSPIYPIFALSDDAALYQSICVAIQEIMLRKRLSSGGMT